VENLNDFIRNIKPIMLKLQEHKRLTREEQNTIVRFYLKIIEVLNV